MRLATSKNGLRNHIESLLLFELRALLDYSTFLRVNLGFLEDFMNLYSKECSFSNVRKFKTI